MLSIDEQPLYCTGDSVPIGAVGDRLILGHTHDVQIFFVGFGDAVATA